ncbi:putative transporter [Carboxydocella thermautotrophica]|nr:putative transporter [Carboxydocella thermautotrophica]
MLLAKGLWLALLFLSVKTGIILGTSWLSYGYLALLAACFGGGLFLLVHIFAAHQLVLAHFLDQYTFVGALMAGILLIYLGLDSELETQRRRFRYLWAFLPCPACMAALAFTVIAIVPVLGISAVVLGQKVALSFSVLTFLSALGVRKIVSRAQYRLLVVFNQLLFFSGLITLAFAFVIPNFVQAMTMAMSPIKVPSPQLLLIAVLIFVGFSWVGYWQYQNSRK